MHTLLSFLIQYPYLGLVWEVLLGKVPHSAMYTPAWQVIFV